MPTVQLSTLQGYVLDRLDNNTAFFTNTQITAAINEAVRISNAFIGYIQAKTTFTTVTTLANIYSTPAGVLYPLQIVLGNIQIEKVSLAKLARDFPNWATDTTVQLGPPMRWAPIGLSQFVIHPNDSVGGRTATMFGVSEPTLLVNATDVLQIEDAFVQLIIEYAAHRVQLKLGGKPFADASLVIRKFWSEMKSRSLMQVEKFPKYWILQGTQEPWKSTRVGNVPQENVPSIKLVQ